MRNIFQGLACFNQNLNGNDVDSSKHLRLEPIDPDKMTSRCDWMKKMRSKRLRNICLPGSHLAASYKNHVKVNSVSKCQTLDVKQQLECGVRFLDTQLLAASGETWCSSYGNQNLPFRDFLATVRDFVKENKTEIVGVSLTGEMAAKDWAGCVRLVAAVLKRRVIPEHMINMPIGDILDQGMNVFLCGLPAEVSKQSWTLFEHVPHVDLNYLYGPGEIRKHLDEVNQASISNMALLWFHAEGFQNQDPKKINFQTIDGEKFGNLDQLSACLNYELSHHLKRTDKNHVNILTMDFVHDQVVGQIVRTNEFSDAGVFLVASAGLNRSQMLNTSGNRSPVRDSLKRLTAGSSVFNNSVVNSSFDIGHRALAPVHFKESNM